MKFRPYFVILIAFAIGCAAVHTVRQQDLDAWVGVSVEALDTHSLFLAIPMVKTITDSGLEIRVYANKRNIGTCFGGGNIQSTTNLNSSSFSAFKTCSSGLVGCDNIFYIRNGKIVEYVPVGRCFTDERVQPEERFKRLISK